MWYLQVSLLSLYRVPFQLTVSFHNHVYSANISSEFQNHFRYPLDEAGIYNISRCHQCGLYSSRGPIRMPRHEQCSHLTNMGAICNKRALHWHKGGIYRFTFHCHAYFLFSVKLSLLRLFFQVHFVAFADGIYNNADFIAAVFQSGCLAMSNAANLANMVPWQRGSRYYIKRHSFIGFKAQGAWITRPSRKYVNSWSHHI